MFLLLSQNMRVITQNADLLLVRFDRGEDIISGLADYCQRGGIKSASFTAIGAAQSIMLAYYNLPGKQYEDHEVSENVEIVSVSGNVACMKTEAVIHTHGVFARQDLSTIGGHIKKLIVSATCEVTLWKLGGKIERVYDSETGLNLLS